MPLEKMKKNVRQPQPSWRDYFRALFLSVPEEVNWLSWAGRVLVSVILVIWGLGFIFHSVESNYAGDSFLHNVDLVFHEAGHIIFSPFGRFLQVLGGSLGQLLIPALVMAAFLLKNRDAFGASVGLWWIAQNFMDLAPYINDARDLDLILLGGVTGKDLAEGHDWEYLLGHLNLLTWDHRLAHGAHYLGALLMLTALVWGADMLWRQLQKAKSSQQW